MKLQSWFSIFLIIQENVLRFLSLNDTKKNRAVLFFIHYDGEHSANSKLEKNNIGGCIFHLEEKFINGCKLILDLLFVH